MSTVYAAVLAVLVAALAWFLYTVFTTPQVTFTCETSGAAIHYATHDNNRHDVVWCTKDGRVVL